jgi:hypothetical protein
VFYIANPMPQTLAPFLLGVGAGKNYIVLYQTAAALTFIGAVAISL